MDFTCDLNAKYFQGLVTGMVKMVIYKDAEITQQLLKEQVFGESSMAAEDVVALFRTCEKLLQKAAYESWPVSKLETVLQQATISEEHRDAFLTVWRKEEGKVHDFLTKASVFNNKLFQLSWRVDVAAKGKNISDLNEPCALVELSLGKTEADKQVARFEMDRVMLERMAKEVETIQSRINETVSR